MAKVQIKSEKLTPFGGIFSIMEQFDALLAQTIDSSLGLRCTDINAKNVKNDKILWEKHCLILGNVYFCTYRNLGNV